MGDAHAQQWIMRITKLEVAAHQLHVAVRLFLEGDYLSSLTLAGAAEEILGRLCERAGKLVAADFIVHLHLRDTDPSLPEGDRKKVILGLLNAARNEAKHANYPNETHFDVEPTHPLQMLMRAVPMCRGLGVEMGAEMDALLHWIDANLEEATE